MVGRSRCPEKLAVSCACLDRARPDTGAALGGCSGLLASATSQEPDGPIVIEHEDRSFEGSDELVKRGFLLARDVLRPYVK